MVAQLERKTVDGVGRIYFSGDVALPSVTTVLSQRPEPSGLTRWKNNYDHWREWYAFTGNRGTLVHYKLLNPLADRELWSDDEASSQSALKALTDHEEEALEDVDDGDDASHITPPHLKKGHSPSYDSDEDRWHSAEWHEFVDELEFIERAWKAIRAQRGIKPESVIDVERFVANTHIGYGGQFDLLYEDRNGQLTLADIKTSKQLYDKHKIQAAAYLNAVMVPIDHVEILRISPDRREWAIESEDDWHIDTRSSLFEKFCELREEMSFEDLQDRMQDANV